MSFAKLCQGIPFNSFLYKQFIIYTKLVLPTSWRFIFIGTGSQNLCVSFTPTNRLSFWYWAFHNISGRIIIKIFQLHTLVTHSLLKIQIICFYTHFLYIWVNLNWKRGSRAYILYNLVLWLYHHLQYN